MVVVVAGPEGPDPDLPAGPTLRLAHDPVEGRGPLAGLAAGLAEVRTELALVAGGDMPDMSPSVLLAMVAEARRSGADAVALEQGPCSRSPWSCARSRRAAPLRCSSPKKGSGASWDSSPHSG